MITRHFRSFGLFAATAVDSAFERSFVYVESRFLRPPTNSVIGKPSLNIVPTIR